MAKEEKIPSGGWKATNDEGNSVTFDRSGEVVAAEVDGKKYSSKKESK